MIRWITFGLSMWQRRLLKPFSFGSHPHGNALPRGEPRLKGFLHLDRTPHDSKHLNVVAREKSVHGMPKG